jgi:hypothetical protein
MDFSLMNMVNVLSSQRMVKMPKYLLVSESKHIEHMNMKDLSGFSGEIRSLLRHLNFLQISMD